MDLSLLDNPFTSVSASFATSNADTKENKSTYNAPDSGENKSRISNNINADNINYSTNKDNHHDNRKNNNNNIKNSQTENQNDKSIENDDKNDKNDNNDNENNNENGNGNPIKINYKRKYDQLLIKFYQVLNKSDKLFLKEQNTRKVLIELTRRNNSLLDYLSTKSNTSHGNNHSDTNTFNNETDEKLRLIILNKPKLKNVLQPLLLLNNKSNSNEHSGNGNNSNNNGDNLLNIKNYLRDGIKNNYYFYDLTSDFCYDHTRNLNNLSNYNDIDNKTINDSSHIEKYNEINNKTKKKPSKVTPSSSLIKVNYPQYYSNNPLNQIKEVNPSQTIPWLKRNYPDTINTNTNTNNNNTNSTNNASNNINNEFLSSSSNILDNKIKNKKSSSTSELDLTSSSNSKSNLSHVKRKRRASSSPKSVKPNLSELNKNKNAINKILNNDSNNEFEYPNKKLKINHEINDN
ncbi:uncharacterized protein ASCRUDRAFT_82506 [Ascoidea rubescens DSM 1968]|uniref:Uncharacterized protein n=1 Tax=Ascoidea rubescens DSM 1968 TaxID=1344418 RepID=A0A1D2VB28_9ASCO|nr:hypothetical protein ASCRUDRAFT_82506 [Ascoidea rubescens DSM 1968]ODV58862.1 hypothetical protein ASCRUDRAFT_82506 [Ascoidea rubescens DSM 1968]